MKRKFWNWVRNENDESRTLFLTGEISDETWYGDEVTPNVQRRITRWRRRYHGMDQ